MTAVFLVGDALERLRGIPDGSVHCAVTSPPFYNLRDYKASGQIGLERTPDEYVGRLVEVFRELRRALRDDGTFWLNLGDSWASSGGMGRGGNHARIGRSHQQRNVRPGYSGGGIKPKDLIGIPWMTAFALRADGWFLRHANIWHKPNPTPASVTDRPTGSHEQVFLLSKSPQYFYDHVAVREPGTVPAGTLGGKGSAARAAQAGVNSRPPEYKVYDGMRNLRDVWTITTKPFPGGHFAVFPVELPTICIKAGTSERGCCSACGAPHRRVTKKSTSLESNVARAGHVPVGKGAGADQITSGSYDIRMGPVVQIETIGWRATCRCRAPISPCLVLDPFGGAGTTVLAAQRLHRDAIQIELNPQYSAMAEARVARDGAPQ